MKSEFDPPAAPAEGTVNRSVSRYELTAVYTHPNASVDIVLVHGLNGSPRSSWTASNGVFWPADLLPAALLPAHANIFVYGYNADVYRPCWSSGSSSPSSNFIFEHAETLVASLSLFRHNLGTHRNPLLWVCHSLGGILVKRALLYSAELRSVAVSSDSSLRSVYVSTFGIVFLGTPHTGADAASWGLTLRAMASAVLPRRVFETEGVLLRALCRDSEVLADINTRFLEIYHRFRIQMVHENHRTPITGTRYEQSISHLPKQLKRKLTKGVPQYHGRGRQLGQPAPARGHILRRRSHTLADVQVLEHPRPRVQHTRSYPPAMDSRRSQVDTAPLVCRGPGDADADG